MFSFMFTLFCASSTDVLANYFHVSLNATLWFFRVATIVIPVVAGAVAYQLCLEMQGVHGVGKRKRANTVYLSKSGAYSTVQAEPRPDDERDELHPEPVPQRIDVEPLANGNVKETVPSSPTGVRQVTR
jgi:ubiquinol-cytochrome c reductase cytochrome b subunit